MVRRRRGKLRSSSVALVALMGVTAGSLAIPLPAGAIKKGSQPFPCQHHACGCADADSCWHGCCCMSMQEKVAWAREHGVTPPKFVLAAAEAEAKGGQGERAACKHRCCLAKAEQDHDAEHVGASSAGKRAVVVALALKCRGVHVSVTLLPPSLPAGQGGVSRPAEEFQLLMAPASILYEPPHPAVATRPPIGVAA